MALDKTIKYPNIDKQVDMFRCIENPTWEQRQAHGEAVEKAVRALQQRELRSVLREQNKRRKPSEWRELYIEAMKEKHGKDWTYETD